MRKSKEESAKTRVAIIEAARRVFHQYGVSRSTLDKVATEAGVTRGAVYHHFGNRTELFFATQEDVLESMNAPVDEVLFSSRYTDPLDAIEAALARFFQLLDESPVVWEVFGIMMARCEYVDEFAKVQEVIALPGREFLGKMRRVYQQAADAGKLKDGCDPASTACDTWAFVDGLLHMLVASPRGHELRKRIPAMIRTHMALRRR
ncbi:TetR family transcriptional regulator [Massilia niastensis]|uniref:TetR family transcriptional regulator n=1 Tax=Massilia niastensis TaxID=544911 RepID=UPI001B7F971D|nr:TetR family transcriptional regulator [Massilia niastensis]